MKYQKWKCNNKSSDATITKGIGCNIKSTNGSKNANIKSTNRMSSNIQKHGW